MALVSSSKRSNSGKGKLILALVAVGVPLLGVVLWSGLRTGDEPTIEVTSDLPAVGQKTTLNVTVSEPKRGLAGVRVEVAGSALPAPVVVADETFTPQAAHKPWGEKTDSKSFSVVIGKSVQADLKPGEVVVTVTAQRASTWLSSPDPVTKTLTLPVQLLPPALSATAGFIHPTQGGAEAVTYDVGESSVRDGVQAGAWFFPGYPLPGGQKNQRFALFAIPYDMDDASGVVLVAEDALGNRAQTSFIHKFFPKPMGTDVIGLNEKFMTKVTTEIYGRTPSLTAKGDLLQDYLQLNRDLRKANNDELKALAQQTQQKFLWTTVFEQMPNTAVKGSFADRRTYTFQEQNVDTQDHLGFDLASVERAPVPAANDGVVVKADYFGIFGNCVVVDHGYGLMSLYAHLTTIDVAQGAAVKKGQAVGKTGATGLAGGDHLHFTMLLHGLAVTPVEWWDDHWLKDRLKLKLGDALPFTG